MGKIFWPALGLRLKIIVYPENQNMRRLLDSAIHPVSSKALTVSGEATENGKISFKMFYLKQREVSVICLFSAAALAGSVSPGDM